MQNVTVQEGSAVTKECKVTSGTANPTVFWENVNTGEVRYGKLLNITASEEIREENTAALQTTLAEVILRRHSLMYNVRIFTLLLFF